MGGYRVVKIGDDDFRLSVMPKFRCAEPFIGTMSGCEKLLGVMRRPCLAAEYFDFVVAQAIGGTVRLAVRIKISNHDSVRMRIGMDVDG